MFLRNFDNAALLLLGCGKKEGGSVAKSTVHESLIGLGYSDGMLAVRKTNGEVSGYKLGNFITSSSSDYIQHLLSLEPKSICLGQGNTEVSYDDYKLSGDVVENKLIQVSNEVIYENNSKEFVHTLIATYTNSTDEVVTINEWGLYASNDFGGSSTLKGIYSNNDNSILLTREVLDEPVVIEPGTTATLTFTLRAGLMHQV